MSRKVAFYGIFAALAILMGYVEAMLPSPVPIQGVKLGLANVIVLIAMYFMGENQPCCLTDLQDFYIVWRAPERVL